LAEAQVHLVNQLAVMLYAGRKRLATAAHVHQPLIENGSAGSGWLIFGNKKALMWQS
jgi:hypothetical protein